MDKNILIEDIPGAKRPSYSIVYDAEDMTQFFTDVNIVEENGIQYIKALFKGKKPICSVNIARISQKTTETYNPLFVPDTGRSLVRVVVARN